MKNLSAILALAILLTVGLACSDSGESTPTADASDKQTAATKNHSTNGVTVDYVTMKNADDEAVTIFKPSDRTQKIAVQLSETSVGKVRGVFTAVNAGGEKNFKIVEKEIVLGTLANTATFSAILDRDFPVGDYKLDVYVNDKLIKTHNYKVH